MGPSVVLNWTFKPCCEKQDNSQDSLGLGFTVGFGITEEVAFQGTWGNTLTDPEDGLNMNMVWLSLTYAWNRAGQERAKRQTDPAAEDETR